MKLCPYCGREYSDDAKYCIVDAGHLIEYDVNRCPDKSESKNNSEKDCENECEVVIIEKTKS